MEERNKEQLKENIEQKIEQKRKEEARAAAIAYAKFLKSRGLKPGELTREQIKQILIKEMDANARRKAAPEQKKEAEGIRPVTAAEVKKKEIIVKDTPQQPDKKADKKADKKPQKKPAKKYVDRGGTRLSRIVAAPIDLHDRIQEASDRFFYEQWMAIVTEYHKQVGLYKAQRKRLGNTLITISVLCSVMLIIFEQFTVYEYAYNGRVLGYVDSQSTVTDVLEVAGESLSKNNNMNVTFTTSDQDKDEGNITFKKVSSEGKTSDDADAVVNKLAYMSDIETISYGIYENGRLVTIVKSENTANRVLESVRNERSVTDKGMELVSSDFKNTIEIKPISVMLASIQEEPVARDLLLEGGDTLIYHIINEGETLDSIADAFSVDKSDIYDSVNKNVVRSYETGDKICIHKNVVPVEVEMVEEGTMSEVVEYKVIKKKTDKMYKGDTVVNQKGIDGKQIITGKVTKINGEVTKRDLTDKEILKKVQNEIILVGTAKRPKTEPTGIFGNPLDPKSGYVITSRVGPRWGSTHEGVDFGVRTGVPIKASDGGEVTISGNYGGYGLCVQIKHNNGYITRYGHCSRLDVKVGDKVYKGQVIALTGNTGRSTGPHLHFEIRKNNAVLDPGPIIGVYG